MKKPASDGGLTVIANQTNGASSADCPPQVVAVVPSGALRAAGENNNGKVNGEFVKHILNVYYNTHVSVGGHDNRGTVRVASRLGYWVRSVVVVRNPG